MPRSSSADFALADRTSGKDGRTRSGDWISTTRASAGSKLRNSFSMPEARELGDRPGQFDPSGAATDDDEAEQALPLGLVVRAFGPLEGGENPAANCGRVVDLLEPGREGLPVVLAEIAVPRARCQHEIVVADAMLAEQHFLARRIDARDLVEQNAVLNWSRSRPRIGDAISAGARLAVATW